MVPQAAESVGEREALAIWRFRMIAATLALGIGSMILWVGVGLDRSGWVILLFPIFAAVPAILLHTMAWAVLATAIGEFPANSVSQSSLRRGMIAAFVFSILGFAIGLSLLALDQLVAIGFYGPEEVALRRVWLIPYIPSVYVPVVAAHVALYLIAVRTIRGRAAQVLVAVGSVFLAGLGILALLAQAFLFTSQASFVLSLAGFASLGYIVVGAGWISDRLQSAETIAPSEATRS